MKKIYKFSLLALVFAIVMPFAMFLTGCGATPSRKALGVYFDSQVYDDKTGLAVFEVDKFKETKLEYKINPSSWSGYKITYSIEECSPVNRARFTFEEGVINVESDDFEDIKIVINVNNYQDTCIVKLKKYPIDVFMYDKDNQMVKTLDVYINAYGSYTIAPYGRFLNANGTTYIAPLLEHDFNFVVETTDVQYDTVVSIPHPNRLKVCSIRKNSGKAKVRVLLNNTKGEKLFELNLNINIVLNASSGVAEVDGYGRLVSDTDSIEIKASDLKTTASGDYILNYQFFVFSDDGRMIDLNSNEYVSAVSNAQNVSVDQDNMRVVIDKLELSQMSFNITFWTDLITDEGSAYAMTFTVLIKY